MKVKNSIQLRAANPKESGELVSWGQGRYTSLFQIRRRKGLQYFTEQFGSADVAGGYYGDDYRRPDKILTAAQQWEVYRRCSDVRSAIDSIVRRVATFDWLVEPRISPQDPQWESLSEKAHEIQMFLERPNKSGQTWQEIMSAFLTDLLCFDAASLELVYDRSGTLQELVPLRGSTIIPIVSEHGVLIKYEQEITNEGDYFGTVPSQTSSPTFKPHQILFMSLYTNTSNPCGNPLIESLVNEVIALMRATEHAMLALDADEIPQGILVLAGIAGRAAEEAKADLQRLKGQDHKIRIMTTPDPQGMGAKWLELRRSPKDISMREIVEDIRKTIYRVFGVMPVEMGMTDGMPRATAQVQMDVSTSHLVTPIIELVQAKINSMILPALVGEDLAELIQFRFDREARLSPTEQKSVAEVHQIYVRNGIMTRNEAREVIGLRPLEGGDVATVDINVGTVPLTAFDKSVGAVNVADVVAAGSDAASLETDESESAELSSNSEWGSRVDYGLKSNAAKAMASLPESTQKSLKKKGKDHNEEYGDKPAKKLPNVNYLAVCYYRGIGAYNENPESVRPNVSSPQQWAMGRVNGLLYALRNGKFKRKPYDIDLLPKEHPDAQDSASVRHVLDRYTRLPLAAKDTGWGWDDDAAAEVLGDPPDMKRYERAFLFVNKGETRDPDGYKLPIAKMVDGELRIVFRGVIAAGTALRGDQSKAGFTGGFYNLDGATERDKRQMYERVERLYARFGEEAPEYPEDRAVGDVDPTNFPKSGDDLKVSLRNSEYPLFDIEFAERIKNEYPTIWKKGGNIKGNEQYRLLVPIADNNGVVTSRKEEEAVRLREAWAARHFEDFRIAGVIAQVKWLVIGSRGEKYMKDLIREEMAKVDSRAIWGGHSIIRSRAEYSLATSGLDADRDRWLQRVKELPSEWQKVPAGVNTIDLRDLGNTVSTYIDTIVKVWRKSRNRISKDLIGASVAERYTIINRELSRLEEEWKSSANDLYDFAASLGIKKAISITSERYDPKDLLEAFKGEQYAFMTGKLLADMRAKLMSTRGEASIRSTTESEQIDAAYNGQEYRIAMYAGALVALTYMALNTALLVVDYDPMTEWIGVGDSQSCGTCVTENGTKKLLSERSLSGIIPASGTQCMTRCRCILSYL